MDVRVDGQREVTEPSEIREFREELLRKQTFEWLRRELSDGRPTLGANTPHYAYSPSDFRQILQTAVWNVGGLLDPGNELGTRTDDAPFPIQLHRQAFWGDQLQVACLLFLDDIRLVHLGEAQDFYPADCAAHLLTFLTEEEPALTPLTDLATAASAYWDRQLPNDHQPITLGPHSDYISHFAEWNGLDTDEFREGIDLLLFASDERWLARLADLNQFAAALAENPSLSLAPDQADSISWALSGLDWLFEFDRGKERPGYWTTTVGALTTGDADDRLQQVQDARRTIAIAAGLMTSDENVAALRRLTRALDQSGNADWIRLLRD